MMTPLKILSCWLTIHEHLPTGCHSRLSTRCSLAQDDPFHSSEWCILVKCVLGNSSQLYRNKNIEVGLLLSIKNWQQPRHGFQRPYLSNCMVMAAFKSNRILKPNINVLPSWMNQDWIFWEWFMERGCSSQQNTVFPAILHQATVLALNKGNTSMTVKHNLTAKL